jgi:hypothetical protein
MMGPLALAAFTIAMSIQLRKFDQGCLTLVVLTQFRGKAAK